MITLEFTDAATMEQQAVQAGLTLPIEQTAVWAKYQNTIDGRTPWGAYVVKQDGAPIAFIALIDYETHGYHYLRSVHGPAWLDKPSAQLEAQVRDLLVEDVRKRDKNVVFLRIDLWNFEGSFPVLSTVPYNETVYVDITGGDEAILTRMKKRGRRDVRKALRRAPPFAPMRPRRRWLIFPNTTRSWLIPPTVTDSPRSDERLCRYDQQSWS